MGFGDILKKVAKTTVEVGFEVGKGIIEKSGELMDLKREMSSKSTSELEYLLKNGNRNEKIVARSLLKERGVIS